MVFSISCDSVAVVVTWSVVESVIAASVVISNSSNVEGEVVFSDIVILSVITFIGASVSAGFGSTEGCVVSEASVVVKVDSFSSETVVPCGMVEKIIITSVDLVDSVVLVSAGVSEIVEVTGKIVVESSAASSDIVDFTSVLVVSPSGLIVIPISVVRVIVLSDKSIIVSDDVEVIASFLLVVEIMVVSSSVSVVVEVIGNSVVSVSEFVSFIFGVEKAVSFSVVDKIMGSVGVNVVDSKLFFKVSTDSVIVEFSSIVSEVDIQK
uniref:Uncharacterized protein n=1 Tax=Panagrolaimus davidi TaxID=227884 RepID=A0A914PWG5_9BILA